MTDAERTSGKVRHDAMGWAMQTSILGEDAMAIVARASLYAEFVLGDVDIYRVQMTTAASWTMDR